MAKYLSDFPAGPLSLYRQRASFDWKKMKIFLETEEIIQYKHELFEKLKKYPILCNHSVQTPSLDEVRHIATKRMHALKSMNEFTFSNYLDNLRKPAAVSEILSNIDLSATVKHSLAFGMVPSVIQSMGTQQHFQLFEDSLNGDILGCYCLTEIGHGSNSKNMQTRATYDKESKSFILHSPNFEAAKCWAGGLGQIATFAIVLAQLITPDGVSHGLHAFIAQIRDPKTLNPLPGITIGDMGEKIGLNGIDNGFVMFNQYKIPKENLLNKTGDVTEDGKYVTPYRDPNKRHGASLGALSVGRINITNMGSVYAAKAISIALRYAAVRKQFGPEGKEEIPILEYQSHQYRLLPYLALTYALKQFGIYIIQVQYQFSIDSVTGNSETNLADLGMELHGISSASKPVASWTVRNLVQECRESCAGHGYLKASGLGEIRSDQDATLTYEGECHVLIQQTSNWLLKLWSQVLEGKSISFPLHSVDFISNFQQILQQKFSANATSEMKEPEYILAMYKWLVCHLLKITHEKTAHNLNQGADAFQAKNDTQVFFAKDLAIAYVEHFILYRFAVWISEADDPHIRNVLTKLFSLYGLWSLQKHVPSFYIGGFATDGQLSWLIRDAQLELCKDLKDDAIALVDVIAPPDFLLNSALGKSDGEVYKHLQATMFNDPETFARPTWWREVVNWRQYVQSKL